MNNSLKEKLLAKLPGNGYTDILPVAVFMCAADGSIIYHNDAAKLIWGRTPVETDRWFPGKAIYTIDGEKIDPVDAPASKSVLKGEEMVENLLVEGVNGQRTAVRAQPTLIRENNEIIGVLMTYSNLVDLTEGEEKQAMLAAIVGSSDDTIISKTLKGIITSWNPAAERMFGYTESEMIGKHISVLIPPERIQEEEIIIGSIAKGQRIDHFETIRVAKDGREIPISLTVSPIKDKSGKIIGASKIARDISQQKQADETSLRYTRSLEIINSLVETVSAELDLNKILQKVTDVTTELTGAQFGAFFYNTINDKGEALMLYTLSGAPKEAFEKFGMPRNTAVFHATFSGEGVVRSADITKDPRYGKNAPHSGMPKGHLPVVSYLAVPVRSRTGEVIGGLFFGHPLEDQFTEPHEEIVSAIAFQASISLDNAKLYDEVKTLSEKKDEFIGLASHELKTPLTSITGYLQILSRLQTDEKAQGFVQKTVAQVKKITTLVSDLLDVSKIQAGKLQLASERFDLKLLVEDAIELIQLSTNSHEIALNTNETTAFVVGDPQRIEQVIINLLTNSIKYSPSAEKVIVHLQITDKEAKVGIQDFGIGIPADKIFKLFSRFYRVEGLNPNISGLGIGLYIAKEIIDRHSGKLWVESEHGKGSTFWFSIPLGN